MSLALAHGNAFAYDPTPWCEHGRRVAPDTIAASRTSGICDMRASLACRIQMDKSHTREWLLSGTQDAVMEH